MLKIFGTVFKELRYTLTATLVAAGVFVLAVWLPNIRLIGAVMASEVGTFTEKLSFLVGLLGSISTNFTTVSAASTIIVAILFGINVALLLFYIKQVRVCDNVHALGSMGIVGLVSGFLGIGCAACGTFVLTSVLVMIGASGILAYLPFGGEEFGFVGIGLLLLSVYATTKKIAAPKVC